MEQVRQGFVKECAKCGCNFADMDSPIPPMHISEIPEDTRKTLSAGYMEYVKYQPVMDIVQVVHLNLRLQWNLIRHPKVKSKLHKLIFRELAFAC